MGRRLIDADTIVHWQSYDDEHETFPEHEGTIAEFLDSMTDEGCPGVVDAVPREIEQANKQAAYVRGYEDGQKDKYGRWGDAVPVVRCRDCKNVQHDTIFREYWCKGREVDPDGYCSDGARKDGGDG